MKELSIKGKAEAYDYAVKKAKELILNENGVVRVDKPLFDELFPSEMEESEDERIRKGLIEYFKDFRLGTFAYLEPKKIIAWLEKQGEQILANSVKTCKDEKKPTDKVEPKFHEGEWVVSKLDGKARQISEVHCDEYNDYYIVEGDEYQIEEYDRLHHLWSIADAKDGDVLEFGDHGRLVVGIVSYVNKTTGKVDVNCLLENNNFKVGNYYNLDTIKPHPATKEQRDLLFQKMSDAGYAFDLDKKEMMKIEDLLITGVEIPFGAKDSELEEVFYSIPNGFHAEIEDDKVVIKKGEKKYWSEEVEAAITLLKDIAEEQEKDYCPHNANDLRKAAQYLETCRPQSTWKPSDEMLKALDIAIRAGIQLGSWEEKALRELQKQLIEL